MNLKIRTIPIAVVIAALFAGTASYAQTVNSSDCDAAMPPLTGLDKDSGDAQAGIVPHDSLSDQLATCGSVLNPPAIGDTDFIQPAPAIDDPMAIHPRDPQLKKK
ncbi:hypothetical protein IHQ71_07650 [Rhizobium sp. TH2]|uniref:hypothetical protein n=1 Tax=Rhizobium sp. TH2 TaxID=2775403 RepID=UPI002157FA2E|nr:hypothetical protein [Rhizobium sp. TH2]UVC10466.1 hypothetical protein IHQ71_07650 [Rhizobium sp. TH2]